MFTIFNFKETVIEIEEEDKNGKKQNIEPHSIKKIIIPKQDNG